MRAPQWVSEFFEWRWAPCVGLTAGSLAFVAFALILIPTHFGEARVVSTLSAYDDLRPQRAIFSSALPRPETGGADDDHRAELARNARMARVSPPSPRNPAASAPAPATVQRGFSPVLERPEPLTPPPAPPPVPPPAPVATLTAAVAVPAPVPAANASAEPPAPMPGTVVVIQPEAGGPAREVTNQ
ncbi:MAG TPA: hypothetical protein VER96_12550 [Polyangiaceae bacterium]|nr:hypothetical protein [Polyangiaceae bacterium]